MLIFHNTWKSLSNLVVYRYSKSTEGLSFYRLWKSLLNLIFLITVNLWTKKTFYICYQEHRKQLHSAIKIQAFVRSYLTRKHCKQLEREEFDNIFIKCDADNQSLLSWLLAKILFFYDDKKDCTRLVRIQSIFFYLTG